MSLASAIARVAQVAQPIEKIDYGPWIGTMRSRSADLVPREYAVDGTDTLYLPRTGTFKRRLGQVIKFDTITSNHENTGALPAKWGAKCRRMEPFLSDSVTDGIETLCALLTIEPVQTSPADSGRYSNFWWRDQVGNAHRTLCDEYSTAGSIYPAPATQAHYLVPALWYDSGDGGLTRGVTEINRRFMVGGSRDFKKIGSQWFFPNLFGTPFRWNGVRATATVQNRIMPTGPFAPTHSGTLAAGPQVENNATQSLPSADFSTDTWTNQADSGSNLFQSIDDTTIDNTDFVQCTNNAVSHDYVTTLADLGITPSADDVVKLYWTAKFGSLFSGTLTVSLEEGVTVRATQITNPPNLASFQTYSMTLTATQISSITSWAALRVRFSRKNATFGGGRIFVSSCALQRTATPATLGGWRGSDRYFYAVAYRDEYDAVWMPCLPRMPNSILANGYNLFTVDPSNATAAYQSVLWTQIPLGPKGTKARLLCRSTKIDSTRDSTLQLVPQQLRVIWEIPDNSTTSYEDFSADDDTLQLDPDNLIIRTDHIMAPATRYLIPGESRTAAGYGKISPVAIEIAPVGAAADYDLNFTDDVITPYNQGMFMALQFNDAGVNQLQLGKLGPTTVQFNLATYDTLEKLVDAINTTSFAVNAMQWRAQLAPGADPQASCLTALVPHVRKVTGCSVSVAAGTAMTVPAGTGSKLAIGTLISMTNVTAGTFITAIVSDTQVTMSAAALGSTTAQAVFYFDLGDSFTGATDPITSYQRVVANSLAGFLFFSNTYRNQFVFEKAATWLTVATPLSTKSAPNSWSGKLINKHVPPIAAGYVMGGGVVDNGFVIPYSEKICAIRNDQNTGADRDYHIYVINETRGCCAWGSVAQGSYCVFYATPQGWSASDSRREMDLSDAIYLHPKSDAAPGTGDFFYEIPLCVAATKADNDAAYLSARVMGEALWVNYRASSASPTHPNAQVVYDFSSGQEATGLEALVRGLANRWPGYLWGWSNPLMRQAPSTAMCVGSRGDGSHLYGWNEKNQGATGDGRLDEFETGDTDNGAALSTSVTFPWERFGAKFLISVQDVEIEHSSPAGATVFLDLLRGYNNDTYTFSGLTTGALDVSRDVKMPPLPARAAISAVRLKWRQTGGGAAELKSFQMRAKQLIKAYK